MKRFMLLRNYKVKYHANDCVKRHKARLVANGFTETLGVYYSQTFDPIVQSDRVKIILLIAAQNKWSVYQLDVKSAFLNGYIDEFFYVDQPIGYEILGKEHLLYKMKKELYGLK